MLHKSSVLHKRCDINNRTNDRPISILPVFRKGIEKIHARLSSLIYTLYFATYNTGFLKGGPQKYHWWNKLILIKAIEQNEAALGIFIGFSRTFDHNNHNILIDTLNRYGVRGSSATLIASCLEHRQRYLCHNSFPSSIHCVTSGVAGDRILGPLVNTLY